MIVCVEFRPASTEMSSLQPVNKMDISFQSINAYLKEPQKPAKLIAVLEGTKDQPISFHITVRPPETLLETLMEERSTKKKPKAANPAKDHEADPLGFQHKTVLSSFLFVSCEIPVCVANLTKYEFDVADTLFNEMSEWEPKGDGSGSGDYGFTSEVFAMCTSDGETSDGETDTLVSEKIIQVDTNKPKYSLFSLSAELTTLSVVLQESPPASSDFINLNIACSYHFLCSKSAPASLFLKILS